MNVNHQLEPCNISILVWISFLSLPHHQMYWEEEIQQYQAEEEHRDLQQFQKLQTMSLEVPQELCQSPPGTCQ